MLKRCTSSIYVAQTCRKEPQCVVLNCQTVIRLCKFSDLLIYEPCCKKIRRKSPYCLRVPPPPFDYRHDRHSLTVISLHLLPSCGHRLSSRRA